MTACMINAEGPGSSVETSSISTLSSVQAHPPSRTFYDFKIDQLRREKSPTLPYLFSVDSSSPSSSRRSAPARLAGLPHPPSLVPERPVAPRNLPRVEAPGSPLHPDLHQAVVDTVARPKRPEARSRPQPERRSWGRRWGPSWGRMIDDSRWRPQAPP